MATKATKATKIAVKKTTKKAVKGIKGSDVELTIKQPRYHTRGRVSDKIRPVWDSKHLEDIGMLVMLGRTNKDIAEWYGVSTATFQKWLTVHEDLADVVKRNRDMVDAQVAESLFKRAVGFSAYGVYYPPDPTAAIFWLCNRQRGTWKRNWDTAKISIENNGFKEISSITIEGVDTLDTTTNNDITDIELLNHESTDT